MQIDSDPIPHQKQSAVVIVIGCNDEVLMGRRRKDKKLCLPGGRIEPNESPITAARREFLEETGKDVDIFAFQGRYDLYDGDGKPLIQRYVFVGQATHHTSDLKQDNKEITKTKWVKPDDLLKRPRKLALPQLTLRILGDIRRQKIVPAWIYEIDPDIEQDRIIPIHPPDKRMEKKWATIIRNPPIPEHLDIASEMERQLRTGDFPSSSAQRTDLLEAIARYQRERGFRGDVGILGRS